jgi:hypothetical protein
MAPLQPPDEPIPPVPTPVPEPYPPDDPIPPVPYPVPEPYPPDEF